mmetsp:Transcript_29488/g.93998  ORF Transcript_29488/g.93998 Transcript_29488/m.93998 type:complete len:130 (+) Transcript_29488:224-613(+)
MERQAPLRDHHPRRPSTTPMPKTPKSHAINTVSVPRDFPFVSSSSSSVVPPWASAAAAYASRKVEKVEHFLAQSFEHGGMLAGMYNVSDCMVLMREPPLVTTSSCNRGLVRPKVEPSAKRPCPCLCLHS